MRVQPYLWRTDREGQKWTNPCITAWEDYWRGSALSVVSRKARVRPLVLHTLLALPYPFPARDTRQKKQIKNRFVRRFLLLPTHPYYRVAAPESVLNDVNLVDYDSARRQAVFFFLLVPRFFIGPTLDFFFYYIRRLLKFKTVVYPYRTVFNGSNAVYRVLPTHVCSKNKWWTSLDELFCIPSCLHTWRFGGGNVRFSAQSHGFDHRQIFFSKIAVKSLVRSLITKNRLSNLVTPLVVFTKRIVFRTPTCERVSDFWIARYSTSRYSTCAATAAV